jgi:hypothetical protein
MFPLKPVPGAEQESDNAAFSNRAHVTGALYRDAGNLLKLPFNTIAPGKRGELLPGSLFSSAAECYL